MKKKGMKETRIRNTDASSRFKKYKSVFISSLEIKPSEHGHGLMASSENSQQEEIEFIRITSVF